MSNPAIALYLGESYATIGLFDTSNHESAPLYEKAIFLPQVSLKNLLNQTKIKFEELFPANEIPVRVYVVTKYFDRLKQFRLGGSISQIIIKGFENSYTLTDSKSLSLAAAQLIISLEETELNETHLSQELERIRKINPDLNKVVISIPEESVTAAQMEFLLDFFSKAGLKIFHCTSAHIQSQLRKTLLNAGSEGTKEEIVTDLKETFGENTQVGFYCNNGFQKQFENCELFTSANNFLAHYIKSRNFTQGAFFDIETLKFISTETVSEWQSPWGRIPIEHYKFSDLAIHPFSEIKLNHLSLLQIENNPQQLEPGPVVAGRAIKPLVIDLFYSELLENDLAKNLFTQLPLDTLRTKISNMFSVLEKGQKNPALFVSVAEVKQNALEALQNEVATHSNSQNTLIFGPLADVFMQEKKNPKPYEIFSWTREIMNVAKAGQ